MNDDRRPEERPDDRPEDRIVEYALGELDAAEAAHVEAHLETSEAARAELRSVREALVALTEALPPRAPSDGTWAALAARFDAETGGAVDGTTRTEPDAEATGDRAHRTPHARHRPRTAPTRAPARRGGPPGGSIGRRSVAVAALALVAGVGAWWGFDRDGAARALEARHRTVAEALAAPGVRREALYGARTPGGAEEALGSVLASDDRAVFVLTADAGPGLAYQAWGHDADDWAPGGDDRLTSLAVAHEPVFMVSTAGFSALYLSLEPRSGSDQPTRPIARLSLLEPVAARPLAIETPAADAAFRGGIVRGVVDASVASLAYRVDDGAPVPVALTGRRFAFTVPPGAGRRDLVVTATLRDGATVEERRTFAAP